MVPTFAWVIYALLLAGAYLWCQAIFGRFRSDVQELRSNPDKVAKAVIVFFWLMTLLIILWAAWFIGGLAYSAAHAWA